MSDAGWVIIGQEMYDGPGVVLLAARLAGTVHIRESVSYSGADSVAMDTRVQPGYLRVRGGTYAEALRMLFEQWSPETLAIEATR